MNKAVSLALLGLITANCAQAADQSLSVPSGVEHDTNPGMTASGSSAVTRFRLLPQYNWQWQRDRDAFTLSGKLLLERSNAPALSQNRHDPTVEGSWQRQTEFGNLKLQAGFRSESSRVAALNENGQLVADATRFTRSYGGQYSHILSEVDTASLEIKGQDASFTKGAQAGYATTSLSMRYGRQLSDALEGSVSATASRYHAKETPGGSGPSRSRQQGISMGLRYQVASSIELQAQAGVLYIPADATRAKSSRSAQGSFSLTHQGERLTTSLSAGRAANVSAAGGYAITDSARIQETYALTEDTDVGLQASLQRTGGFLSSQSTSAGVDLNHRLAERWRLSFSIQRREVDNTTLGTASGTLIGAQLVFSEPNF